MYIVFYLCAALSATPCSTAKAPPFGVVVTSTSTIPACLAEAREISNIIKRVSKVYFETKCINDPHY
jgi:hypothetical protein